MAKNIKTKPEPAVKQEPVNSEQLEAAAKNAAQAPGEGEEPEEGGPAGGPTTGELEERAVIAEERAEGAERRVCSLEEEMALLKEQINALMRGTRDRPAAAQDAGADGFQYPEDVHVFDESQPYGTVVGDLLVAYVQNGHQFGRDRRYIETEKYRGSPRAFNPRMVGMLKPRPGTSAVDALEGFRDQ